MNFSLRQLRAFTALARTGSFTRAALDLHLSQPALTVQIRELERALGLKLVDRNTRRVQLTSIGRELLPVFDRVLGDIRAVAENARELAAGDRGTVNVAALPSVCSGLLPAAIARLRETHPGIVVRLHDTVAQRILALLRSEEADIGIGSFATLGHEFESTALMEDRMVAVFPRGHPLGARRSVALKELRHHPLIFMDTQSSVRAIVERGLREGGVEATPDFEVTYMSTAIGLVRAGLGVAILPAAALELQLAPGLDSRAIRDASMRRRIVVATRRGRSLAPAVLIFRRLLDETISPSAPRRSRR
jgi:LysR family transcriptional regulator, carnitine catabolism transcriptional activator